MQDVHIISSKLRKWAFLHVKPADAGLLGDHLSIGNVDFKPSHRKLSCIGIREVVVIRIHHIDEIRVLMHTHVVLDIFKHDLDDGIAVRDVLGRKMRPKHLIQVWFVGVGGSVLLESTSKSSNRETR